MIDSAENQTVIAQDATNDEVASTVDDNDVLFGLTTEEANRMTELSKELNAALDTTARIIHLLKKNMSNKPENRLTNDELMELKRVKDSYSSDQWKRLNDVAKEQRMREKRGPKRRMKETERLDLTMDTVLPESTADASSAVNSPLLSPREGSTTSLRQTPVVNINLRSPLRLSKLESPRRFTDDNTGGHSALEQTLRATKAAKEEVDRQLQIAKYKEEVFNKERMLWRERLEKEVMRREKQTAKIKDLSLAVRKLNRNLAVLKTDALQCMARTQQEICSMITLAVTEYVNTLQMNFLTIESGGRRNSFGSSPFISADFRRANSFTGQSPRRLSSSSITHHASDYQVMPSQQEYQLVSGEEDEMEVFSSPQHHFEKHSSKLTMASQQSHFDPNMNAYVYSNPVDDEEEEEDNESCEELDSTSEKEHFDYYEVRPLSITTSQGRQPKSAAQSGTQRQHQFKQQQQQLENSRPIVQKANYSSAKARIYLYIRVRPADAFYRPAVRIHDVNTIEMVKKQTASKMSKLFCDRVYGPLDTQESVWDDASDIPDRLLSGKNACMFAYGSSAAGKTFTLFGKKYSDDYGLLPRIMRELFTKLKQNQRSKQTFFQISMVSAEFKGEYVRDLLHGFGSNVTSDGKVVNRQPPQFKRFNGHEPLTKVQVVDYLQFEEVMRDIESVRNPFSRLRPQQSSDSSNSSVGNYGLGNSLSQQSELRFGSERDVDTKHLLNSYLLRANPQSHFVVTINVEAVDSHKLENVCSTLSIVDLASSDIASKQASNMEEQSELQQLRRQYATVAEVLNALLTWKLRVPYRDSKLTTYLRETLEHAECKVGMYVCIHPQIEHATETQKDLKFASRVKTLRNVSDVALYHSLTDNAEEGVNDSTSNANNLSSSKGRINATAQVQSTPATKIQQSSQTTVRKRSNTNATLTRPNENRTHPNDYTTNSSIENPSTVKRSHPNRMTVATDSYNPSPHEEKLTRGRAYSSSSALNSSSYRNVQYSQSHQQQYPQQQRAYSTQSQTTPHVYRNAPVMNRTNDSMYYSEKPHGSMPPTPTSSTASSSMSPSLAQFAYHRNAAISHQQYYNTYQHRTSQ